MIYFLKWFNYKKTKEIPNGIEKFDVRDFASKR